MKTYLTDVLALSLIFGIISALASPRYKKCVSAALGLILSAHLLLPLGDLSINFSSPSLPWSDGTLEGGEYTEAVKLAFESGICSYVSSEMSIDEDCIEVEAIGFNPSSMRAEKILVTLSGAGVLANTKKVKALLEKANLGEAEVKIEI